MLTMMDTLHDFWFLTILTYLADAENFGQVWHFLKMLDDFEKKNKRILTTFDKFCLQMLIIFAIFLSSIHDNFSYRSPTCKFWWIHPIFTNFSDIFVENFVDSLKFSLFLVIDFSPILPLLFSQYMFTNFGDFFLEFFCES